MFYSIGEQSWYDAERKPRTILLIKSDVHQRHCLASKYDVWGFQDCAVRSHLYGCKLNT